MAVPALEGGARDDVVDDSLRMGLTVLASEGSEMMVGRRGRSAEEEESWWWRWWDFLDDDEWWERDDDPLRCFEEELCLLTEESALEPWRLLRWLRRLRCEDEPTFEILSLGATVSVSLKSSTSRSSIRSSSSSS